MHVSLLDASHAAVYRELMLEAYELAADAFTSTAQERANEPEAWWIKRIGSPSGLSQSLGAFAQGELIGTVAIEYSAKPKTRHSGLVIGMYVRPIARNGGVGAELLRSAIEHAQSRPEVSVLRLTLTEGNTPALRLYESQGFVAWGTEPQAILTSSGFKGKVHMSLQLPGAQSAA